MGVSWRPQLVLICGTRPDDVRRAGDLLRGPGSVLVEHDLRGLAEGVVERRVTGAEDWLVGTEGGWTALELIHGCVNCTLREDLLPLLMRLAREDTTRRIVVLLDPGMEPESVAGALQRVLPDGEDEAVLDLVEVEGVVAVLDAPTWLADAGSDEALADHGLALAADDDRTVAQLVVGQAEFADLLLLSGALPEGWDRLRLEAVLARLAPRARRTVLGRGTAAPDMAGLLADLPISARREQLVVLTHEADPEDLVAALDRALLTDEELGWGEGVWRCWDDPFGTRHADPCASADLGSLIENDAWPGGVS